MASTIFGASHCVYSTVYLSKVSILLKVCEGYME